MKRATEIAFRLCMVSMLAGFVASLVFLWTHWGWWWAIAGFIALPAGIMITPMFAVLDYGIWLPAALTYGPVPVLMLIGVIQRAYPSEV